MWARPRAKIRGVWRVFAGLKARCSGVSGLTCDTRGQSCWGPGLVETEIQKNRGCGSMFSLDLYNNKNIRRESDHKQQSSILLLV